MLIRKIEIKDLEETYKLLNELYKNEIDYNIYSDKYKQSLKDSNFYGIVAEEQNKVIGVLISKIMNRLVKSKNILFIDDFIVNKDYRSKGVGKLLLQNAVDYAIEKDCQTIELTSYMNNEKSHKFYENNGFKKQHYKFKMNLN